MSSGTGFLPSTVPLLRLSVFLGMFLGSKEIPVASRGVFPGWMSRS